MLGIICAVILNFSHLIIIVASFDNQRYFIPTQEHFVAQQSHQALLHQKNHGSGFVSGQLLNGWPNPNPSIGGHQINLGGNIGALSSANSAANAGAGVSFGGFPQVGNSGGGGGFQVQPPQFTQQQQQQAGGGGLQFSQLQPQFFGGTFGLGFGFGGGWYNPYVVNPFLANSGNVQNQHQQQQQLFQHQQSSSATASASASASSSAGFQFNKPQLPSNNNNLQLVYPAIPYVLQPSQTGWDTSYNVPCGTYQIKPFVVANLRLGTASSPFVANIGGSVGRRKRRSPFNFPHENEDKSKSVDEGFRFRSGQQFGQQERSLPSFFPQNQFMSNPPPSQPKTCSWTFNSDGYCKLKFKCLWFQLPALVSCNENYMIVTDTTPNLNNTFCGNRKPRKVYNSSNGKLILIFRSQSASLPAVFDCAVTCSLEASPSNVGQKPQSHQKLILSSLTKDDSNFTTSTENDSTLTLENKKEVGTLESTSGVGGGGVTSKPRLRIGDCRCGVQSGQFSSKGRIVGGSPTTVGEFSWAVALVRKYASISGGRPFCSGSLISDRYAITAAHCVSNNKIIREPRSAVDGHQQRNAKELFDVILIEHDVTRLDDVPGGSLRSSVDKIIVHPRYNNVTFDFDVALIRLENPIQFSSQPEFYRYDTFDFHSQRRRFLPEIEARPQLPRPIPICLPSDKDEVLAEKYATVTGWGLTTEGGIPSNELLKATVQIFNDSLCKEIYKEYNYPVTDSMICAGYMTGKVDACVGDSGGGLIVKENEKYTLAGITSWGRGCGRAKQPGVYTKIPALLDWIRMEASDGIWCI